MEQAMKIKKIKKVLIANRGEIAVRIIRTLGKMGITSVAVYARPDVTAMHVQWADESWPLGDGELSDTYLNVEKIMAVAKMARVDAIHPGYGFLSENPALVSACEEAGIRFIGPDARSMQLMGNKIEARNFAISNGLPVTQGVTGTTEQLLAQAGSLPFPLLVKAAAGGGGKGMRIVRQASDLEMVLESTSREAKSYFGDGTVYIEQFIEEPRHIEIQVLGDAYGNIVHLYERECTIQRRYQKIIEESPSATLTPEVREKMGSAAVTLCKAIGYRSAGTIEFLVDKQLQFYFLEMNTRIQVEHPVTEMVSGYDLVEEQIHIAEGHPLRMQQDEISQNGHAIECRVYAEDPAKNFLPSPGKIQLYIEPDMPDVRIDSSMSEAAEVHSFYDPMISKLIAWGENREQAIENAGHALSAYVIHGIKTNIPYLLQVLQNPMFAENQISTGFCDAYTDALVEKSQQQKDKLDKTGLVAAFLAHDLNRGKQLFASNTWEEIGYWRHTMCFDVQLDESIVGVVLTGFDMNELKIEVAGEPIIVKVLEPGYESIRIQIGEHVLTAFVSEDEQGNKTISNGAQQFTVRRLDQLIPADSYEPSESKGSDGNLFAPMPGKVIKVNVKKGDKVERGTILLVVEAMKMENNIVAAQDAVVEEVRVSTGDMVDAKTQLVVLGGN